MTLKNCIKFFSTFNRSTKIYLVVKVFPRYFCGSVNASFVHTILRVFRVKKCMFFFSFSFSSVLMNKARNVKAKSSNGTLYLFAPIHLLHLDVDLIDQTWHLFCLARDKSRAFQKHCVHFLCGKA